MDPNSEFVRWMDRDTIAVRRQIQLTNSDRKAKVKGVKSLKWLQQKMGFQGAHAWPLRWGGPEVKKGLFMAHSEVNQAIQSRIEARVKNIMEVAKSSNTRIFATVESTRYRQAQLLKSATYRVEAVTLGGVAKRHLLFEVTVHQRLTDAQIQHLVAQRVVRLNPGELVGIEVAFTTEKIDEIVGASRGVGKRETIGGKTATINRTKAGQTGPQKPTIKKLHSFTPGAPILAAQSGGSVGKVARFALVLRSFVIGALIEYGISKIQKWLFGDPIEEAFKEHIKKLEPDIRKAINAKTRDINALARNAPGKPVYAQVHFEFAVATANYDTERFFAGAQLVDVWITDSRHSSGLTKRGFPDKVNSTWTGPHPREYDMFDPTKPSKYFMVAANTTSYVTSVELDIGDIGGTWIAGRIRSRKRNYYSAWAVFTFGYDKGNMTIRAYLIGDRGGISRDKNTNTPLNIQVTDYNNGYLQFKVTQSGVNGVLHIEMFPPQGVFMHGKWKFTDLQGNGIKGADGSGEDLWFRPKHYGLQRALSRGSMGADGVNPIYKEFMSKFRQGKPLDKMSWDK